MLDYIPPELIPNILARLPAEDVLRCTSVCKSWYSLVTSPSFATLHLKLSSPNQEPRLLVKNCKSVHSSTNYYLHRDNETFDEVADLDSPLLGCIIDSLNGLVCLYDFRQDTLVLWNPSLRKSFTLPKPKVLSKPRDRTPNYGFGFIASSNDYKVLRLSCEYDYYPEPQVEIYQLSTNSWRDLEVEDYSYFIEHGISPEAHLDDVVHWYKSRHEDFPPAYSNLIYSFDMKTEKFGALMVPSCLGQVDEHCEPSTFRELLCLTEYNDFFNIWVMKEYGITDSWEKIYSIDMEHHNLQNFCHFRDSGEVLFQSDANETCGNKRELVSYDCNDYQVKNLGVFGVCLSWVYTYMDSLALINGPNEVKIDEESTMISKTT